jgi:hypothetical protein
MSNLSKIIGKTPTRVYQSDEEIIMTFSDNSEGAFFHDQDCCECVEIDDVNGDWDDLLGTPLLVAEERVSEKPPEGQPSDNYNDSNTWTFYTFRGIGGSVDVRWHGSSNGYYSESVTFRLTEEERKTNE